MNSCGVTRLRSLGDAGAEPRRGSCHRSLLAEALLRQVVLCLPAHPERRVAPPDTLQRRSCSTACEPRQPTGYAGWRPHAVTSQELSHGPPVRRALVCFLHQAWRDTLDQAVDMYGKLLDRSRKRVEDRLDAMLKRVPTPFVL